MTPVETRLAQALRCVHSVDLPWKTFIAALFVTTILLGCNGGGGPNTQRSFRAVLVEPPVGSGNLGCADTNGACVDTIRVTFNNAIDTTFVLDDEAPRFFLASLSGGNFVLDVEGTTVSNQMRTLVIPFQFVRTNTYEFVLRQIVDTDGNPLENTASTSFTIGDCTNPCP